MGHELGVDIHEDKKCTGRRCWRCAMDVALYGEAWWDTETMAHLNPNDIYFDSQDRYQFRSPPPTVMELINPKSKLADEDGVIISITPPADEEESLDSLFYPGGYCD